MRTMLVCKVCGCEFKPTADAHYICRDDTNPFMLGAEPKLYDAFDCPLCCCQIIVGSRRREDDDYCLMSESEE